MPTPRAILTAAALMCGALLTVPAAGASAATPPHYNVARDFCGDDSLHHYARDCVEIADVDTDDFVVRNHAGHQVWLHTPGAIKRYLRVHATPCAHEDSDACYWDAARSGNHHGHSFVTVARGGNAVTIRPAWFA